MCAVYLLPFCKSVAAVVWEVATTVLCNGLRPTLPLAVISVYRGVLLLRAGLAVASWDRSVRVYTARVLKAKAILRGAPASR
jgi:hypothetical protein